MASICHVGLNDKKTERNAIDLDFWTSLDFPVENAGYRPNYTQTQFQIYIDNKKDEME